MGSKMLIDATHSEETRVVVVRGNKIDEFDFESAARKQLKGNIYLAKVTRVEPSLQAAFVDYGGNRHGFLAFSEIHPDYYQIPIADRQALLRQERDDARRGDDDFEPFDLNGSESEQGKAQEVTQPVDSGEILASEASLAALSQAEAAPDKIESETPIETSEGDTAPDTAAADVAEEVPAPLSSVETVEEDAESAKVDSVGAEDILEEVPQRQRRAVRRHYKIQEVIKRRQVILVQVVKEERGNKGAALTTYLSLAGRYCVLMPNTARGGGISRKITDANDRRRLKEVAREVEVPEGMGLIVRTAGAQRTKTEIKRDFDYLMRLWESVRDLTLSSTAPSLVYEEGDLIRRSIRDLYTKDVDEVLVEGEDAYRGAKDFMKMLMPSHARNVKLYKDTRPLFSRYQVETQLDSLFSPTVTLPSGGYMVINQTEALVSVDINSGKSTREHNIEDTALRTNLEAADEIARQLRLRDLAGLIVIDFIDMEEKRNNRSVERRLKEALKHDRARIQVGRISHFGLLEMSRQRLRQGMLEGSTKTCPHCEGRGIVRSVSSCALSVLRSIEEQLITKRPENLTVQCHRDVASYILNEKRDRLLTLEQSFNVSIFIVPSDLLKSAEALIERGGERTPTIRKANLAPVKMETALVDDLEEAQEPSEEEAREDQEEEEEEEPRAEAKDAETGDGEQRRGRRRRRRGRRGGRRNREEQAGVQSSGADIAEAGQEDERQFDDAPVDLSKTEQPWAESSARFADDRERKPRAADQNGGKGKGRPADGGAADQPEPSGAELSQAAAEMDASDNGDAGKDQAESQRRWSPPQPTVDPGTVKRKAGWWQRRSQS
ncbi:MAG TPA: ribonuclease E/G [Aestuariivirgaceae bacterium]